MKISPMLLVVCGTALPAFCTGCLITRHTTNTVRKNEKPVAVQFESPRAKNVFESKLVEVRAVQNMIAANPRVVAVPFLLWWSSTEVVSGNGIFNDQVAICDANGDRVITLEESLVYAARVDEQVAKNEAKNNEQSNDGPLHEPTVSSAPHSTPPASYPAARPDSREQPLEARQPQAPLPPGVLR